MTSETSYDCVCVCVVYRLVQFLALTLKLAYIYFIAMEV